MSDRVDARAPLARLRHDLRTPLNAIIGYSEVLEEEAADHAPAEILEVFRSIGQRGRRLLGIVTQTLAEVEQEANGAVPEGLPVRMARVMAHEIDLLQDDLARLRRLGGASDDVARLEAAAGALWGLATGRRVWADPRPSPLPQVLPPVDVPSVPEYARGRVLVVDDAHENRALLRRRLQLMGHEVEVAESGEEALDLLTRTPVDVVLLDILMPGMDGLEVLGHIRRDPRSQHLPVIMLSALDNEQIVVRSVELGADDFVPKPFDPVFLRARVGACLEKKRLRDAEDAARAEVERQRARIEELLAVIFPRQVLPELKAHGSIVPRRYEHVAVVFCDVVDFTRWSDAHAPEEVVARLQTLVEGQEALASMHGLQKIKTIGDAFMAAAGLFDPCGPGEAVRACVAWGHDVLAAARQATGWNLRIGIHVGPVVGGVVGQAQSLFDLWGDTVNTAARMESHGVAGAVCLTRAAWEVVAPLLAEGQSTWTAWELEPVDVKGKGRVERWEVIPLVKPAEG